MEQISWTWDKGVPSPTVDCDRNIYINNMSKISIFNEQSYYSQMSPSPNEEITPTTVKITSGEKVENIQERARSMLAKLPLKTI